MQQKPGILILYNPYYQKEVIALHLEILKDKGAVFFGKVRSKIKNQINPQESELEALFQSTSKDAPLQLFFK